jgi:ATP-dependent DNA ligase
MRLNQAQEFVISGYTPGGKTFDALIFGYYSGAELVYAGRTRSGFTPAAREQLSGTSAGRKRLIARL